MADRPLSEEALFALICARFQEPAYAVLPHVNAGTGAYTGRTADAIAMGVWPSRGFELHGFEIKSYRSDWLRELRQPAKAEGLFGYMHRWWIVTADKTMIQTGELPPTWGWLAATGGRLTLQVDAPRLDPKPISYSFLAAVLRNASRRVLGADELAMIQSEAENRGHRRGYNEGLKNGKDSIVSDRELRESVAAFEAAAGIKIAGYAGAWSAERVGAVIRWWTAHDAPGAGLVNAVGQIERAAQHMLDAAKTIREDELPDFRR